MASRSRLPTANSRPSGIPRAPGSVRGRQSSLNEEPRQFADGPRGINPPGSANSTTRSSIFSSNVRQSGIASANKLMSARKSKIGLFTTPQTKR